MTPRYPFEGRMLTAQRIAAFVGISSGAVRRRIRLGLPMTSGKLPHGKRPKLYEFRGGLMTAREIMALTGYARPTITKRNDGVRVYDRGECTDPFGKPPIPPRWITFDGVTDTLAGWSLRTGLHRAAIASRLDNLGWSLERALTEPSMTKTERARQKRNAQIIQRMLSGFHKPVATLTITIPLNTGGYSTISTDTPGTGGGSRVRDLQSEMKVSP